MIICNFDTVTYFVIIELYNDVVERIIYRASGVKLILCSHGKGRRDLSAEHSMRITVGYGDPARGQARKLLRLFKSSVTRSCQCRVARPVLECSSLSSKSGDTLPSATGQSRDSSTESLQAARAGFAAGGQSPMTRMLDIFGTARKLHPRR